MISPDRLSSDRLSPDGGRPLTGRKVLIILIAFFGTVFSMNVLLLRVATNTFRGLETDSAYRASQTFNADAQAARDQAARGWTIDTAVTRLGGDADIVLTARDATGRALDDLDGTIRLARPAEKRLDKVGALKSLRGGRYAVTLDDVAPGQWDVLVTLERDGERVFHSRARIVLK